MADNKDYLSVYRCFFEEFAATVIPDDQLPVKVAGYYLCDSELVGEIVDWTLQYLNQKHCPSSLLAPLTRIVIEEIKLACKKQPLACGYRTTENTYQPLKLMQVVTGKVNEICLRYCDNGKLATLPPPSPGPPISSCAIKNTRRRMEDRHVIIEDFHLVFNVQDRSPTSYYAIFDGHAGTDAAVYSVSHLHQFLAESSFYPTDPEKALKDAFSRTDALFLEKSNRENLRSGTTVVCALLRHKEKKLYVAWLGDSQALMVHKGHAVQMVNPHKPDRQDERARIENMGGCVMYWGTWRVNGQLAVSRAIGDFDYKPFVISEPDITVVSLDGTEDFLILACDGLWDFVPEEDAVEAVYEQVHHSPGDLEAVSERLVQLSKEKGSTDNISVIVVFLTDPAQLASRPVDVWANLSKKQTPSNTMDTSNNPFASDSVPYQKAGLLLDLGGGGDVFKQNGTSPAANDLYFLDRPANGRGNFDDEDFGPETDVDAVDDVLLSPSKIVNSSTNNNPFEDEERERTTLEADLELQRQQLSDFDPVMEPREETPTPPADEVPGVTSVVPESDNVAESGEDSEDEWNYYRVEPTADTKQQSTQSVCQKSAQQLEEEANMESQLNPDAAEFVPSPTQLIPAMEDILLAESPKKAIPMENISVPTHTEFQDEITQRPSELDAVDAHLITQQKIVTKLPDLVSTEEAGDNINPFLPPGAICGKSVQNIGNGSAFKDFLEQGDRNFQELQSNNVQGAGGLLLDESEVSSTKAEYDDDSTVSFLTSELQKTTTESTSFIEQDMIGTEFASDVSQPEFNENEQFFKGTSSEESFLQGDDSVIMKNMEDAMPPMSFELQKELVPEMESKPERVQLESEGTSSFEQDDSSSPVQAEDSKRVVLTKQDVFEIQAPVHKTDNIADTATNPLLNNQIEISDLKVEDKSISPSSPRSLHSPPMLSSPKSPTFSKPQESRELLQDYETPLQQPNSPFPSELLGEPVSPKPNVSLSSVSPVTIQDSESQFPLSKSLQSPPKSPLWEGSSLVSGTADTTLSTPETVPLGKETQSPSPLLETKSPIEDLSPVLDKAPVSHDTLLQKLEDSVFINQNDREQVQENILQFNATEPGQDMTGCIIPEQSKTPEALLEESISTPLLKPNDVASISQTAPSDLTSAPVDVHTSQSKEFDLVLEKDTALGKDEAQTEGTSEKKGEENGVALAAATAAATVATAVAAGSVMTSEEKKPPTSQSKKPVTAVKDKKELITDKTKPKTTTTTTVKAAASVTTKLNQKSTPTSPTKPLTSTRTSTPKKTIPVTSSTTRVTKSPVASATKPKVTSTTAPAVKIPTSTPKTSTPTKPATQSSRPRLDNATTASKSAVLTNGETVKSTAAKKPRTTVSAATKPPTRPGSAPAKTTAKTTTVTNRTSTLSSAPRLKPGAVNGTATKPRTTGTVSSTATRTKMTVAREAKEVTDKQVKETANKQISSARSITATKSVTSTAIKRVTGVTKTSSTSNTVKSAPSKSPVKKMTTTASSKTTTKTAVTVTTSATGNNELVNVQQVTATVD